MGMVTNGVALCTIGHKGELKVGYLSNQNKVSGQASDFLREIG